MFLGFLNFLNLNFLVEIILLDRANCSKQWTQSTSETETVHKIDLMRGMRLFHVAKFLTPIYYLHLFSDEKLTCRNVFYTYFTVRLALFGLIAL